MVRKVQEHLSQSSSKRHKTPITQQLEVGSLQRPVAAHASILAIERTCHETEKQMGEDLECPHDGKEE